MKHKFVEYMPNTIENGILYISLEFGTILHKCVCGCGNEVNTPLSPTDWKMIYDGESITLKPSIGNWSFDCKSHYWIRNNSIVWDEKWDVNKIEMARKSEVIDRLNYFKLNENQLKSNNKDVVKEPIKNYKKKKWSLFKFLFG
jgi:hypothetical protein